MKKILDLDLSVYQLCSQFPELKEILVELGFKDITKPLLLNTMGKMTTLKKGARIKNIPLEKIVQQLTQHGFEVIHKPKEISEEELTQLKKEAKANTPEEREILLKSYVIRLNQGEALEQVRKDFVANFKDVSAVEIARAEQALLQEGAKLEEVQKLCDVHSALFHGATKREKIMNAEKEVARSREEERMQDTVVGFDLETADKTNQLIQTIGHPLQILSLENREIEKRIEDLELKLSQGKSLSEVVEEMKELRQVSQHFKKKQETIYPLLKVKYDYPGPSEVMWAVEDELKMGLDRLIRNLEKNTFDSLPDILGRLREMIYKEENILFPIVAANFSEEEWIAIRNDFPIYEPVYIGEYPLWDKAVEQDSPVQFEQEEIQIGGGHMSLAQLEAMLNTLQLEITLVDADDTNLYFNDGEKLFTRPKSAIGRPVFSCHPVRVLPMVKMVIGDFKSGKRDSIHILSTKNGHDVLVNYYALRSKEGKYLGTLEAVQILDELKAALVAGKKGMIQL